MKETEQHIQLNPPEKPSKIQKFGIWSSLVHLVLQGFKSSLPAHSTAPEDLATWKNDSVNAV